MDAIAEIGSAFLTIAPSLRGFDSKLNATAGASIRSSGKSLGAVFGKAFVLGGAVLAAAGVGSFLKDSIGEAREAQKVGALTTNVIKQTGGAANISAKQVGDLSTAISLKTGIDDEAIQSGANLLLTFKNVRNEAGKGSDVFNRATQAATDLSAAGFGDLNGASKQLGKALNDPVKGITALSRSGVTFTDQQKAQIKTLTESGKTLDAQKIILGEVESQVGGAAAASSTYGEKAGVAFGNIKEQVGTKLLPVIDGLAQAFLKAVPTITKIIDGIGPAFARVQAFLAPFIAQIQGFFAGGGGGGILSGVQSFIATIQANFLPVLQTMASTFTTTVLPAITSLATYIATNLFPIFQQVAGIITSRVLPIISSLAVFFYGTLYPAVIKIVSAIAQNLKPIFDQLVSTLQSQVLPAADKLLAAFQRAQPTIQKVALVVVKVVGAVLKFAAAVLGKVIPVVIRLIGFLISKLVPIFITVVATIARVVGAVINFGKTVANAAKDVGSFAKKVGEKIGDVLKFFKELPNKIVNALKSVPDKLKTIGGNIIDGLKKGITDAGQKVLDAVKGIIDKIPKFIRKRLGIASPSKVTTKLGEYTSEGLARGIANGAKKAAEAAKKLVDGVKDALKGRISSLQDDFSSLADSVSSAFTGNLFEATNAGDFINNLLGTQGQLQSLKAAFKTLLGYGLQPGFLSQLFASGNAGLILDLAAQDQATATQAGALFGNVTDLSSQLGNNVAQADVGPKLDKQIDLLQQLVGLSGGQAVALAKEINGAATGGKKKGHKGSGGKGKK